LVESGVIGGDPLEDVVPVVLDRLVLVPLCRPFRERFPGLIDYGVREISNEELTEESQCFDRLRPQQPFSIHVRLRPVPLDVRSPFFLHDLTWLERRDLALAEAAVQREQDQRPVPRFCVLPDRFQLTDLEVPPLVDSVRWRPIDLTAGEVEGTWH